MVPVVHRVIAVGRIDPPDRAEAEAHRGGQRVPWDSNDRFERSQGSTRTTYNYVTIYLKLGQEKATTVLPLMLSPSALVQRDALNVLLDDQEAT